MTSRALCMMTAVATGCGSSNAEASPLRAVAHDELCVTKGSVAGGAITEPTVRAFARGTAGDSAQLSFKYVGDSEGERALDSGEMRRQVGIKLRAADSCNVVYVMWRISPKPGLAVQVKSNPGMHRHEECGTSGYIKVKPSAKLAVPLLEAGTAHVLRAEIRGDELLAWIDGQLAWQGRLPDEARAFSGPAGLRTDNVRLEAVELHAPKGSGPALECKKHEGD